MLKILLEANPALFFLNGLFCSNVDYSIYIMHASHKYVPKLVRARKIAQSDTFISASAGGSHLDSTDFFGNPFIQKVKEQIFYG